MRRRSSPRRFFGARRAVPGATAADPAAADMADLPPSTAPARLAVVVEPRPALTQRPTSPALFWLLPLLLGALGLAALAQWLLLRQPGISWSSAFLLVGAVLGFALAALLAERGMSRPPVLDRALVRLVADWWRYTLVALATLLVAVLLFLLQLSPPLRSYNLAALLWLAAIVMYLAAIAPEWPRLRLAALRSWLEHHSALVWVVLALLVLALGLRLWQIDQIPATLGGDEGEQGLESMAVLSGRIGNPFGTGWLGVPTMSFYFNALTIQLFGNTIFGLRLPWALVGTATVLSSFLLATRLKGLTVGLMTAMLLATYHYHIHYSRLGSNQIADALFVSLALLFFYRGYDRRAPLDWALSGVVVGVSQYFYAGARFTAILMIALLVYFSLRDRAVFWRQHWRGVLVMVGAVLLTSAPMIQYAIRFPNDYNARLSMVGIFQNGWLQNAPAYYNKSLPELLLIQFEHAALAFNAYHDQTVWYGSPKPLFDFADGTLFLLGLGYASLCVLDRRLIAVVFWWWGGMVMGGFLTENPPSTQRLVTLSVPAVFLVALALGTVGRIVARALPQRWVARALPVALGVAVLALSAASVRYYFADYTPRMLYGGANSMTAMAIGTYARDQLDSGWRIYFFGPPRMYIGFGSIRYLAPQVEGANLVEPLPAAPDPSVFVPDKSAAFVFLPERAAELATVRQLFPNGTLDQLISPLDGKLLAEVYRVPSEQLARH